MGKSFFDEADEERGNAPALTGALLEIVGIDRTKTGERAKNPGLRMYVVDLRIKEPKKYTGITTRDWITVGTVDDPFAKRPETWKRSEGGPGRLKRLLTRAGVPLSDDDDEWMEAAEGHEVVAPIHARADENGVMRNRPGLYYRASDEDCPEIGEAENQPSAGDKKPGKKRGAAEAAKSARGKHKAKEEEESKDEEEEKEEAGEDDEEDEKPKKKATESKSSDKKAAKPKDDEDDEEDDD